jgi:hypothetical protein
MTVAISPTGTVVLAGACPVEDAEVLLQYLLGAPTVAVDWSACESAHSAVIQVLLVGQARLLGTPANPFLRDLVGPALMRVRTTTT